MINFVQSLIFILLLFSAGSSQALTMSLMYGDKDGLGLGLQDGDGFSCYDLYPWDSSQQPDPGTITDRIVQGNQEWEFLYDQVVLGEVLQATIEIGAGGQGVSWPSSYTELYMDNVLLGTLSHADTPTRYTVDRFVLTDQLTLGALQFGGANTFRTVHYTTIQLDDGTTYTAVDGWALDYCKLILSDEQPVPEPATLVLFGTGLGVVGFLRKKRRGVNR